VRAGLGHVAQEPLDHARFDPAEVARVRFIRELGSFGAENDLELDRLRGGSFRSFWVQGAFSGLKTALAPALETSAESFSPTPRKTEK